GEEGGRVGGQQALLLLLGQQGRDGRSGLAGGEHGPSSDRESARGHGIGAIDVEAFGGELAGQGDGMLVAGAGGVVDCNPGGEGGQGEGEQAGDHCLSPADATAAGVGGGGAGGAVGPAERRRGGGGPGGSRP